MARDLGYENASYVVWNRRVVKEKASADPANLDPNYIAFSDFDKSPWNKTLKAHARKFTKPATGAAVADTKESQKQGVVAGRAFDVDIHGKRDPKKGKPFVISVGFMPMAVLWKGSSRDQRFVERLRKTASRAIRKAIKGTDWKVNTRPYLHGYWGIDRHTISEQAVRYKMAAIQLELPKTVRRVFCRDIKLLKKFSAAIATIYEVVRNYTPNGCDPNYAPGYKPGDN
jgi:hypothetical protein